MSVEGTVRECAAFVDDNKRSGKWKLHSFHLEQAGGDTMVCIQPCLPAQTLASPSAHYSRQVQMLRCDKCEDALSDGAR